MFGRTEICGNGAVFAAPRLQRSGAFSRRFPSAASNVAAYKMGGELPFAATLTNGSDA